MDKKINESILEHKWPINNSNIEDNLYKLHVIAYNRKMDQLVPIDNITPDKVAKLNSLTCIEDENTNTKNEKETTPPSTPRLEMVSNDMH